MGFTTDGSSHRNGVKSEHDVVQMLNDSPPAAITSRHGTDITFKHLGGTRVVTDATVHDKHGTQVSSISLKRHEKGTYDYINTSLVSDYVDARSVVDKMKEIRKDYWKDESRVEEVRRTIDAGVTKILDTVTSEAISKLLNTVHKRSPEFILIREMKSNTLHMFPHDSIDELSKFPLDPDTKYELRNTRAKTSRQIWRITNGEAVNTNLRLRLALNNGVTALLGLSKSNTSCSITIKLQQDSVAALLKKLIARS
jgi:hypothetical protein